MSSDPLSFGGFLARQIKNRVQLKKILKPGSISHALVDNLIFGAVKRLLHQSDPFLQNIEYPGIVKTYLKTCAGNNFFNRSARAKGNPSGNTCGRIDHRFADLADWT